MSTPDAAAVLCWNKIIILWYCDIFRIRFDNVQILKSVGADYIDMRRDTEVNQLLIHNASLTLNPGLAETLNRTE